MRISTRAAVVAGLALMLLVGIGVAPAGAWGSKPYTAPWGCSAWLQSKYSGGLSSATTTKTSQGNCAMMGVRLRTASGGGLAWYNDPNNAFQSRNGNLWVGGWHRVCSNCTSLKS